MSEKRRAKGALPGSLPVYQWKPDPAPRWRNDLMRPVSELGGERLTGVVQDTPATPLEERFDRALAKLGDRTRMAKFQPRLVGGKYLPVNLSLSYAVYAPNLSPVQIDNVYPNNSSEQHANDQLGDMLMNTFLNGTGARPVTRLSQLDLGTQAAADASVARLF